MRPMTEMMPRALGIALLFALAPPLHADAQAPAAIPPGAAGERVMLPAFVTPQHYRIDITPDADALTFKGTVQIDITVNRSTDKIVLNSADIVIDRAAVSGGTAVAAIRYDEAVQTATLALGREIKAGAYTLSLAYHGKIYLQASGLFALDYRTAKGKARALFTQFENSDARRAYGNTVTEELWTELDRDAQRPITQIADDFTLQNDQLGVLNYRSALAYAGDESMAGLLELSKKIGADAEPVVASALVHLLQSMDDIYQGLPSQAALRAYARGVLEPIFRRVGWNKKPAEADNVALLRSDLIAALGDLGDPKLLAQARTQFDQYVAGTSDLDAGTRRAVLGIIAVHADPATWDQLHRLAKSAATEMEQRELYDLLAAPQSEPLVRQALELAASSEPPSTIAPEMISSASRRHPEMALGFAIAHWDLLRSLIEPTSQPAYVPNLLGYAWDLRLIDKLNAFAERQIPPNARQDVVKSEAHIRYYAAIRNARLPEVDQWLKTQGQFD